MQEFRDRLPELRDEDLSEKKLKPTSAQIRQADFEDSAKTSFDKLSFLLYSKVVATWWFEGFIMLNILLIGIATGLDLQFEGRVVWYLGPALPQHFTCNPTTLTRRTPRGLELRELRLHFYRYGLCVRMRSQTLERGQSISISRLELFFH
jgi:hypothetical protein